MFSVLRSSTGLLPLFSILAIFLLSRSSETVSADRYGIHGNRGNGVYSNDVENALSEMESPGNPGIHSNADAGVYNNGQYVPPELPYHLSLDGGRGHLQWGVASSGRLHFRLTCKRGHDMFALGFSERGEASPADYVISYKGSTGQRVVLVSGVVVEVTSHDYNL